MSTFATPRSVTLRRGDVLRKLLHVLIHRYQKRLAREHLAAKERPVAVFAFDVIGAAISIFGRYEREELDALLFWLDAQGRLDGACVDVGANIGNHALFFASAYRRVFAFEPHPRIFELLRINAAQTDNITCFNAGLSSEQRQARIASPTPINMGVACVLPDGDARTSGFADIRLLRLDDVGEIAAEKLGLVKIDVEGHELDVLKGASGLIARDRPIVVFEQSSHVFSNGSSPSIEFLKELGYTRFLTIKKSPQLGNPYVTALARLICGERVFVSEFSYVPGKVFSMIIAA